MGRVSLYYSYNLSLLILASLRWVDPLNCIPLLYTRNAFHPSQARENNKLKSLLFYFILFFAGALRTSQKKKKKKTTKRRVSRDVIMERHAGTGETLAVTCKTRQPNWPWMDPGMETPPNCNRLLTVPCLHVHIETVNWPSNKQTIM